MPPEVPMEPVPLPPAGESEPFSPESPALSPGMETTSGARKACGAGTPAGHGGKCTNYIDLEIPYLFINFIAHINHVHLMKRFTPYLTVLLPAIISLCLSGCNVTYRTSIPSMPWKMATDSIKPDIPPKFNGGDPAAEFPQWVYQNLRYPEEARRANASGTALVEFTVNPDGTISDINVQESPHYSITKEIIKIFSESPLWTPAYLDGKPIGVTYTMPLIFRIPNPVPRDLRHPVY